jgi:hypothetical protein
VTMVVEIEKFVETRLCPRSVRLGSEQTWLQFLCNEKAYPTSSPPLR